MIEIDASMRADWQIVYNKQNSTYLIRCRSRAFVARALDELCRKLAAEDIVHSDHGGDRHE